METELRFKTLIELFNRSLARPELAAKQYLEILRTQRQETLTFDQLKTGAQDFTLRLIQHRDIQMGDKIAILGKNRADWDIALWGIILAGAVPVLIDPERPPEAITRHLNSTDTRLLVMADDYQNLNSQKQLIEFTVSHGLGLIEMTGSPHREGSLNSIEANRLLNEISSKVQPSDTAVIVCTSGTTADPREVELTHANLIANIQGALQSVKITSKDKLGHIIPPHHSFGFTVTKLLPLWVGASNVYTNRYRHIPQIIRNKNITIFIGIPALFTMLAKHIEDRLAEHKQKGPLVRLADRYFPKSIGKMIIKKQGWKRLRFFLSGAAPLPKWTLDTFWKRGLQLREGYGTTENSPVYGFNSSPQRLGSVGKPIPTLSLKIVNDKNETLRAGDIGEIVLGGPCIMKGYYKNPQATQAVIRTDNNGVRWMHTGDLGYLDEDGHLYITGRKKYVIVLPGGKNVNPELVESVLLEAEYIKDVLVVPSLEGHDSAGAKQEAVGAIVQPAWEAIEAHTKLTSTDLAKQPDVLKRLIWENINRCQQKSSRLSHFERVAQHRLQIKIDEFVKTSTGKIKRDLYVRMGP
jgi:long-chain acyl-CoA synthetase